MEEKDEEAEEEEEGNNWDEGLKNVRPVVTERNRSLYC